MKRKEDNGIEFEDWNKTEEELEISRKTFRTSVGELDDIMLQINDQPFQIVNLTHGGIGIHLTHPDIFSVGQLIDSIELHLEGTPLTFQGEVRHISPMDPEGFLCGVELIEAIEDSTRILRQFIQKKIGKLSPEFRSCVEVSNNWKRGLIRIITTPISRLSQMTHLSIRKRKTTERNQIEALYKIIKDTPNNY